MRAAPSPGHEKVKIQWLNAPSLTKVFHYQVLMFVSSAIQLCHRCNFFHWQQTGTDMVDLCAVLAVIPESKISFRGSGGGVKLPRATGEALVATMMGELGEDYLTKAFEELGEGSGAPLHAADDAEDEDESD